jgi:hypothetical protein
VPRFPGHSPRWSPGPRAEASPGPSSVRCRRLGARDSRGAWEPRSGRREERAARGDAGGAREIAASVRGAGTAGRCGLSPPPLPSPPHPFPPSRSLPPRPSPPLFSRPSPPLPPGPSPPPAPAPRSSARGTGPPAPGALPWRSSARGAGWGAGRGAGLEGGGGIPPAPRSSLTRRSGASRCPRAVLRMERTRTLPRTLAPCPPERSWGGRTWVSPSTRSRSPASRRSPPAELGRTEPNRMRGNGVTG